MTIEQLEKAKQSGAVTAGEIDIWYSGYLQGQKDTFEEVTKDVKATVETIPDYMNDAILEQSENERRMKLKDKRERYSDYSDQEER